MTCFYILLLQVLLTGLKGQDGVLLNNLGTKRDYNFLCSSINQFKSDLMIQSASLLLHEA